MLEAKITHLVVAIVAGASIAGVSSVADALTPLPDSSPSFFAGEWTGPAENGGFCYVKLDLSGVGSVLLDSGSGDFQGASVEWRNDRQNLTITKVIPMAMQPAARILSLGSVVLKSGFSSSMAIWKGNSVYCQVMKIDKATDRLAQARAALAETKSPKGQ